MLLKNKEKIIATILASKHFDSTSTNVVLVTMQLNLCLIYVFATCLHVKDWLHASKFGLNSVG